MNTVRSFTSDLRRRGRSRSQASRRGVPLTARLLKAQDLASQQQFDPSPPTSGGAAGLFSSAAAVAGCSGEKLTPGTVRGIVVAGVARRGGCWGYAFILLLFYNVFFVLKL